MGPVVLTSTKDFLTEKVKPKVLSYKKHLQVTVTMC